ncbi:phage tail spike protein [Bacillus thuringiensis]|nr:phage tail spike protein [Bacillus thuringiensis]
MYPIVYPANEKEFQNNGLGVLSDVIDINVIEELNGQFELEMMVPIKTCNRLKIEKRMFIFVDANETDQGQPFRIYEYDKADDDTMFIRAKHITFDTEKQFLESYKRDRVTTIEALHEVLTRSEPKKPWRAWSDMDTATKVHLERQQTSDCIQGVRGSILDAFGGEIKRDGYRFEFHKKRGRDNGVLLAFQKNMTGIEVNIDIDSIVTRIFPYAQGKNEGEVLTLPERFINSPYMKSYDEIFIRPVEIQDVKNLDQLRNKAKRFFTNNKVDIPKMHAKISFVPLQKVAGYEKYAVLERVALGDTVYCSHPDFPEVSAARVIRTEYDPITEMYHAIEIGDAKASLTGGQKDLEEQIKEERESDKTEWRKVIDRVTDKITGNSGGHVVHYPKHNPSETLYMDKDDMNLAKQVLRINKEGIGFSKTGVNGPFETAWTVDGEFVADFITAGTLSGDRIQGGEITGSTLKTSDSANFVNISKQFIRLYESSKVRSFIGYYKNSRNEIQPTFILGGDSDHTGANGAIMLYQFSDTNVKSGGIGITKGMDGNGYLNAASIYFSQTGNAMLDADKSIVLNAQGDMRLKTKDQVRFYRNDNWIASIGVSSGGDTDIMLPNATIRNSNWDNGYIQVKTALGTYYQGVIASDFKVSSKAIYKTNIRPITCSILDKVMDWKIKQYNLKTDIPTLYEKRMNRKEGEPTVTTEAIPTHYGLVIPKESEENGVGLYGMLSQLTKAFQEYVTKTDARIQELEPIQPKGNVKRRNRIKRKRRPPRYVKKQPKERSVI